MLKTSSLGMTSAVLWLLLVSPLQATIITVSTDQNPFDGTANQGWWSNTDPSVDSNHSYFTGNYVADYRSFFSFDLSSLGPSDIITSATLQLRRFGSSAFNDPTETIGLFDVSTPAASLNANSGVNSSIYTDLGTGVSYGTFVIPGAGLHTDILSFTLNAAAISDLNAAKGAFFSVGAALTSQNDDDYVFGSSGLYLPSAVPAQQLILNFEPALATPEPMSLVMLLSGMAIGLGPVVTRLRKLPTAA